MSVITTARAQDAINSALGSIRAAVPSSGTVRVPTGTAVERIAAAKRSLKSSAASLGLEGAPGYIDSAFGPLEGLVDTWAPEVSVSVERATEVLDHLSSVLLDAGKRFGLVSDEDDFNPSLDLDDDEDDFEDDDYDYEADEALVDEGLDALASDDGNYSDGDLGLLLGGIFGVGPNPFAPAEPKPVANVVIYSDKSVRISLA